MNKRRGELGKHFAGHFTVSLLGTAVDTAVLWVCSHLFFSGSYFGRNILSPVISFECALLVNFCNCYFFVWKDRISKPSVRSFFRHYGAYNLSCTGVFLLRLGLLQLILLITGLDVVWCNLIAMCFSGIVSFLMNEKVIFRSKNIQADASHNSTGNPGAGSETQG